MKIKFTESFSPFKEGDIGEALNNPADAYYFYSYNDQGMLLVPRQLVEIVEEPKLERFETPKPFLSLKDLLGYDVAEIKFK